MTDDNTPSPALNEQPAVADPSSSQDRSFTVLSKLPYELQNMVWTIGACEPRVVEIHTYTQYLRNKRKKTELRFISRTLVPAILHVSSGSRKIGLMLYERLCFKGNFTGTYINWAADFIRFNTLYWSSLSESLKQGLSEIDRNCKRLIIRESEFGRWNWVSRVKNVVDVVLLCGVSEHRRTPNGNLTLVPINHPEFSHLDGYRLERYRQREKQVKILNEICDLEAFARSVGPVSNRIPPGPPPVTPAVQNIIDRRHLQHFGNWDARELVASFQGARKEGKNVNVMHVSGEKRRE